MSKKGCGGGGWYMIFNVDWFLYIVFVCLKNFCFWFMGVYLMKMLHVTLLPYK
jgi:hypothetical protein